jgi:ankyrin repeat protein
MHMAATRNARWQVTPLLLTLVTLVTPLALPPVVLAAAGDPRLADAVLKRDAPAVRVLLGQKVDVNAPGKDGTPALHWAVRADDIATTRLLLAAGADPNLANRYGVTPLFVASSNGNTAMIELLLEAGADPNGSDSTGEPVLMAAVRVGTPDAVQLLLDRGATLDAKDPTFEQTPLMVAVRENHPAVVKRLVERGAQVNAKTRTGDTPAWILPNSVPGFGHGIGIVRGGLPDRGLRTPIPGAMSPLLYAARDGRLDIVQTLVAAKADVNQADNNGITPLIDAITNNHVDVARFLIDHGADINASDWYGRTPLWSAVETRNQDFDANTQENSIDRAPFVGLIKVLIERGANVNVRTKGGLHRPDAIPHRRACGRRHRDASAPRARRRPEDSDDSRNHRSDGRGRHQLGLLSDVRRGTEGAARSGTALLSARDGRECRQFNGADGAARRGQPRIG